MAITKKQQPGGIHSVFKNAYYIYSTDQTGIFDYYYKFNIKDATGVVFSGNTVPLENNLSMNYPNEILKNETEFNFNPSASQIENVPNNIYVYNENITEFNIDGVTASFNVQSACRYSDDIDLDTYIMRDIPQDMKFLSKMNSHKVRNEDEITLRTFNGYLNAIDISQRGLVENIMFTFYFDGSGSEVTAKFPYTHQPYFRVAQSNISTPTVSGDDFMIEAGVGLGNLQGLTMSLYTAVNAQGIHVEELNPSLFVFDIDDNGFITFFNNGAEEEELSGTLTSYKVEAVKIYGIDDYLAFNEPVIFNYHQDCRFDSINVAWENNLGGVDYHLFTKANEKSITTTKNTYEMNGDYIDFDTENVEQTPYGVRTNVYRNKVTTFVEVSTDWLTQEEINGLEDIYHSTNVYMKYEGEWVYVINTAKKSVIYNKKRKGLKRYVLNFELSSKKYRY